MHAATRIARLIARRLRAAGWRDVIVERSPHSVSRYVNGWNPDTLERGAFRISDHALPSGNDTHYLNIDLVTPWGEARPAADLTAEAEQLVADLLEDA